MAAVTEEKASFTAPMTSGITAPPAIAMHSRPDSSALRSGILAAVILGMGRAIGETMAVIMVAGNAVKVPNSALDSARTLTANIALEMGYATGVHRQALFATGVVLFVVIMVLNALAMAAMRRRSAVP